MISALGYIAGTLLAPNFAGYLLSKGLTNREEKKLTKEIEVKVIEFNRMFDDTEVDSNYFVDFLEQKDISKSIIERVFNTYKASKEDYCLMSKNLAIEAVDFVNKKKDRFNHPHVKRPSDFEDYFSKLFDVLIDFRESLLSIKDKAMVSVVDESIRESQGKIIESIEDKLGDNYLLEQRINDIGFLIDKGLYSDATQAISEIFETMGSINKEQRVKLLHQKARAYVDTEQVDKISSIQKSIRHLSPESSYLDEIDYWISCKNHDIELMKKSIESLRVKGTEDSKLVIKESSFYLSVGDFDKVKALLLDADNNVKSEFKDEASAFSQLGFVALFSNDFVKAELYFGRALNIKYSITYDYHLTIARAFTFMMNLRGKTVINEELKEKARQIYNDLERTEYFIKGGAKELRIQHWGNYLSLIEVDNPQLAIEKFENIDKDLIDEEGIQIIMSEVYFFANDYENAANYLEKVWTREGVYLARLLHCYDKLNEWEKVAKIFDEKIEHLYDSQGVILHYKIQLYAKTGRVEEAKHLIISEGDGYKKSPWFIEKALSFLHDNSMKAEYEIFKKYALDLPEQIEINEKLSLSRMFYNHREYIVIRKILEKSILVNEEALELYLYSYGDVNPKNEVFDELQQVVLSFYSNGNRLKYLLQVKFYIELMTERYIDAMDSLSEYCSLYGKDSFYQVNLIQCSTLGSLDYDANDEVKELLSTGELKNHIIVAQYFAYKGRWEDAKSVLRNAYYSYDEQIGEEEIAGFLRIYFSNFHQDKSKAEYNQICDDSVAILEDSEMNIINVGIHSNDGIISENGESKFECTNLKSTSDESFILKATGMKGSLIQFSGQEYKVLDVLDLDTYFFRYFLKKIQEEYPENKTVIPISGETIEEMIEKTMVYMKAGDEAKKSKLKLYNFEIETGVPITYLSGKDVDKYLETIYFLMNNEEQGFYSVYSDITPKGSKYVLTVSSLVILNALGYMDKVKEIADRFLVAPSIKPFVRKGISDAIKYDAVVSTAFLDEDSNFRMEESTEATKVFKKTFWTQVLNAVNGFNETRPELLDTSIYDKIHEFVDISEFEAISIAKEQGAVLVCDDLFIAKVCNGIEGNTSVVNAISLIYQEELINIDELIKLVMDLTKKKYLNCINHKILFDIYVHLGKSQSSENFDEMFKNVSLIFESLFGKEAKGVHSHLYKNFMEMVMVNNLMSGLLYKLLQKPLGFKPYEELIASAWSKVWMQFNIID